jgi:hypothetical protein
MQSTGINRNQLEIESQNRVVVIFLPAFGTLHTRRRTETLILKVIQRRKKNKLYGRATMTEW